MRFSMKIGQTLFAVFVLILLSSDFSNAKMYKYVDENGVTTYQDYPPENFASDTKIKVLPTVQSKNPDTEPTKKETSKGNLYRNAQVELYVTSWCKYCKKAANYFRSKGVPFTEYDIEKDKAAARRKDRLSPKKGVPFAIVNGKHIYGFAPNIYENALTRP